VAGAHTTLGNALRELGDAAAAASHYEQALTLWREILGTGNPQTLRAQFNLAQLYVRWPALTTPSRLDALYRDTLELGILTFGFAHPTPAIFRLGYAEYLLEAGRNAEALAVLTIELIEEPLQRAGTQAREKYSEALLTALDRLGCRVASNSSTGLDRARVLEELPLIRAARCDTDPQVRRGP
jgi:tetratricopeptide (TPR) repeat protein